MNIQEIKGNLNFQQVANINKATELPNISKPNNQNSLEKQPVVDTFEKTQEEVAPQAGEIGRIRLATGFLTDEQIAEINATRKLPENAKFISSGFGDYYIANNFFGLRAGTQTLPEGFEVKKNIIGQAVVVAKDTQGILVK